MAGHSKWSSIKHKKGAADAKRGKVFTRLVREIILAARDGGDMATNPRLRTAVQAARGANMPKDNIDKAIKRGTGEIEGVNYEEIIYEGYGQAGVAIIIDAMTDNKNRTVAEVRHAFSKYGGTLAENGAVAWNFEQKGLIEIDAEGLDEDEVMMNVIEAGADDMESEDGAFFIYTQLVDFSKTIVAIEELGYKINKAELTRVPKSTVNADSVAEKLLNLIEKLEDLDDVQKVYANFDISDEVFEKLSLD
ncbi:MAG: YebC/PmpR family DNA-binding transcriptional regulator [Candidatus Cloacimonadales bacterium]|jgi:YebC/PmpR family DNA-binding regulatory protein|nr:YebC/PmpR family DNA-binding transcriptional regulator [Candidatus Cloacimonadota bacterium]MDD2649914.1 YebC/PmpR family DNA-binding transcriptional regulator [Candidatus Cloacimonadota bacterium]MDX9976525.1 YebC/PmpR family DNA-binding transcriptional regulator [Candidatus Cloacimonadales bacterium]